MKIDPERLAALRQSIAEHAVPARPVSELRESPGNAKAHPGEQVEEIALSMLEWGWTSPVLVDEGGVILAGHGRRLAAILLGLAEVPVLSAVGWSEAQKRAYVIADNKITENGGWDADMLKLELGALQADGFNLDLTGFHADELASILSGYQPGGDPEDVPPVPPVPVSRLGDLWVLGNHRLLCGDSTSAGAVARLLDGAAPHLMVTDPPYGVDYDPNWRNEAARNSQGMGNRAIGAGAVGLVSNDDRSDWREAWALFPGDVAYVWHAGRYASSVQISLEAERFEVRSQIIWSKSNFAIGRGDYHWQHEPCWYAVRKGKTGHWNGDRKQTTVWDIAKPAASETGHSTQKPVECMKRPIENNSKPGDAIYEPFCGSGTTIVACEMTDRLCYAMELDPTYIDTAVRRWEKFSGKRASLDGRSFDEVAAERQPSAA